MISAVKTLPWKIHLDEFTSTDHPTTIERTLNSIYKDRLFVTLVANKYKSVKTVLTGIDSKNILIDRPVDWQESISSAKIYFRDAFKVWNFFPIQIACNTHDTIYATIPEKIHRLQRRRHFRIAPPADSKVSFVQDDQSFNSVMVNNISAGGLLISTDDNGPSPAEKEQLNGIMIRIPSKGNGTGTHTHLPLIDKGNIVRSFTDSLTHRTYYGISFSGDPEVKEEISKYVIHREQQILRNKLKSANEA